MVHIKEITTKVGTRKEGVTQNGLKENKLLKFFFLVSGTESIDYTNNANNNTTPKTWRHQRHRWHWWHWQHQQHWWRQQRQSGGTCPNAFIFKNTLAHHAASWYEINIIVLLFSANTLMSLDVTSDGPHPTHPIEWSEMLHMRQEKERHKLKVVGWRLKVLGCSSVVLVIVVLWVGALGCRSPVAFKQFRDCLTSACTYSGLTM